MLLWTVYLDIAKSENIFEELNDTGMIQFYFICHS